MQHTKPAKHIVRTMLLCHILQGKKAKTTKDARGPPEGFDSGGDGPAGWINCAFENCQVYPSYEINFHMAASDSPPSPKRAKVYI
jgi:hypothetical protein